MLRRRGSAQRTFGAVRRSRDLRSQHAQARWAGSFARGAQQSGFRAAAFHHAHKPRRVRTCETGHRSRREQLSHQAVQSRDAEKQDRIRDGAAVVTELLSQSARIHLIQGDCRVTADPEVIMTTVLGSCIATCMRDPVAMVGGMNHFLLPEGQGTDRPTSMRYGAHAMELLVNALLTLGARRERLEAKLFGGARMTDGL